MTLHCLSSSNPNPNFLLLPSKNLNSSSSMASSFSFTPGTSSCFARLESLHSRRNLFPVAGVSPPMNIFAGVRFRNVHRRNEPSFVSFAASQEDSKPSEGETEDNLDQAGKASQEAWQNVLASFKEQALKLQSVSQEAYEEYSKKAVVVLTETAETLKIQADQAKQDLFVLAKELGEDSRQYLTIAAENSPEPVKDVVETFASAEDLNDVSKVSDFYVGIPYGTILSAGGFLNFMLTGSISALRFGVILGGILLALSVSSLRLWKKGQSTERTLKGQAAIAGILALRDISLLFQGLTLVGLLKTVISGSVAAFFIYRIIYNGPQSRPSVDGESSN